MTSPRYTRQHLFTIRNNIPIDRVIEALSIPSSNRTGIYRFSCPVCNEQNTGINPKTNLARCFNCEKNYNTIDLVMKVMDVGFIQSVAYLEKLKADKQPPPAPLPTHPRKAIRRKDMVHIGDVFKSLMHPKSDSTSLNHPPGDKNQAITDLEKRVSLLEQQITQLTKKLHCSS
ncbi:MAG: DNA primase [Desulfamplus sp.]|nr:DNA primase [Desulfamplus sp.]